MTRKTTTPHLLDLYGVYELHFGVQSLQNISQKLSTETSVSDSDIKKPPKFHTEKLNIKIIKIPKMEPCN